MTAGTWDKMDRSQVPTFELATAYTGSPLWVDLCRHMEAQYQPTQVFEYSGCSVPGWNLKLKKSGRSLCTLYPMEGWFTALVVIGNREKAEFDLTLPTLSGYTQTLYETTKDKNGLCWLMFEVKDESILSDVKRCIAIRGAKRPA